MSNLQGRSVWYHIIYCDFKVFVDTQGAHSGPQCRHHDCRAGHHYNQHFPRCSWWPVSTVSVSHKRAATENSMQGRTETSITWCLWLCSLIRAIKALKSRILSHLPFYGCDLDWSWTFLGVMEKTKKQQLFTRLTELWDVSFTRTHNHTKLSRVVVCVTLLLTSFKVLYGLLENISWRSRISQG